MLNLHLKGHLHLFSQATKIDRLQSSQERLLVDWTIHALLFKDRVEPVINYSRQLRVFKKCYVVNILPFDDLLLFCRVAPKGNISKNASKVGLYFRS